MEKGNVGRACFLDVETTGFSARTEEVVELAVCLFDFRRDGGEIIQVVDTYVGLREPGVPISAGAAQVHGLRMKDLCGKRLDHGRVEKMIQLADFIVAHNARFDRSFVSKLIPLSEEKQWLCSMSGVDWYGKGFSSRGLQNLLLTHGISTKRSHRAEDDVRAALTLLGKRGSDGRTYFAELLRCLSAETANRAR
ncbi:MAG: DNA polymerase III PolC-type [Syntrophomonadaceae bacterium]|nr:DNA polymerase III PolC-type [Bacillota bacterium]